MWLDAARTSPFRFYQFWFNADDRDVITYLKFFTFKTQDEIAGLEGETNEHPERREAQRELARAVTAMVHGADQVARAERAAEVLFGGPLAGARGEDILMVFDDAPSISVTSAALERGIGAAELAVTAGLAASKGEAARIDQTGRVLCQRRTAERRARTRDNGGRDRARGDRAAQGAARAPDRENRRIIGQT